MDTLSWLAISLILLSAGIRVVTDSLTARSTIKTLKSDRFVELLGEKGAQILLEHVRAIKKKEAQEKEQKHESN